MSVEVTAINTTQVALFLAAYGVLKPGSRSGGLDIAIIAMCLCVNSMATMATKYDKCVLLRAVICTDLCH